MPLRTTRPDCGGMYGTGSYGQGYYGRHKQCGYVPPVPPVPPDDGGGGGGGESEKKRRIREDQERRRRDRQKTLRHTRLEAVDAEEIELILSVWLNLN